MHATANLIASAVWMPSAADMATIAPEIVLVLTLVVLLLAPLFAERSRRITSVVALSGALLAATASLSVARGLQNGIGGPTPSGATPMLVVDSFSLFFKVLLMVCLVCVVGLWILGGRTRNEDSPEYAVLLFSSALGMDLMVSTTNLLMLIVAMELASLPSYVLAGFVKRHRISAEASIKYVIFGAICSAVCVYGASLFYGYWGTLDLAVVARQINAAEPGQISGAMVALIMLGLGVGLGFKASAVPLHFWCPDVFEGAPIEIATWLSIASKGAGLVALMRMIFCLTRSLAGDAAAATLMEPTALTIGLFGAITCTAANLIAYRQTNMRRLLAYSSIAHAGYMLMAGAITSSPTDAGLSALAAYLIVYLLMNVGAFTCVAMVGAATGSESTDAFRGLRRRSPALAVGLVVCLFSLIGLPPLGGFIAKFKLLWALGEAGRWWLVIVAVINTFFSLYYYARWGWVMFFEDDGQPAIRTSLGGRWIVTACAIGLVLTGTVLAPWLLRQGSASVAHLYQPLVP